MKPVLILMGAKQNVICGIV